MNENDLETLLREQQDLVDDGFSINVMNSLPKRRSEKSRLLILFASTSLGSLCALLLMGGASTDFFRQIFDGLATYNPAGLGVAFAIVMLYATLFVTTSEELA